MSRARSTAQKAASAPRGAPATLGGAIAILVVWAGSLDPSVEQMGALTMVCSAALEWLAGRFGR